MANLFTSGYSSFLILRRDLEDVLDEMELPWRMRREMDRLFAESTSPIALWRNMEHLLEDFGAPFVLRRRIETVFARVLGRGVDAFGGMNHGVFTNHGSHFSPSYNSFGSQSPYFTNSFSQSPYFMNSFSQSPYFTQGYGSHFTSPYFTQSQFTQSPWFVNSSFNQNPWLQGGFSTPSFTGRDWVMSGRNDWFNSPRNEWSTMSRFNDGFTPVRNWTRGGVFGNTFGNGFGNNNVWGNTLGNSMYGNTLGANSFNPIWGNGFGHGQFGNTFGHGQLGNTFGHGQLGNGFGHGQFGNTFGGNTFGQFGNTFGQFGNTFGQFGNTFGQFGNTFSQFQDFVPPVELIEREGEFVVRVELAGVREQDVEIRANEHVLTIRGERRERFDNEVARHVGAYEYSERRYGTFSRTVTLPQGIDASHIHAVFRDGVLELRIPQAETFRQRRIPIGRIDETPRVINDGQGLHQRPHVS